MFINNKYTKLYYKIVESAKDREVEEYTEKHHIIPRSLGGSNAKDNLVVLTGREHFICHWLLTKMTSGPDNIKMVYALAYMKADNYGKRYHTKITARVYAKNRIQHAINHSKAMTGRKMSEEQKKKISIAHTGKIQAPPSEATREKLRIASTGRKHSPEALRKMSENQKGKKITGTHLENLRKAAKNKPPVKEETKKKLREAFFKNSAINSPESIEKRRAKRMGHEVSEETRQRIRETLRETYRKKGFKVKDPDAVKVPYVHKGYAHTEEAKQKMRKPKSPETKEKMRLASIQREAEKKRKKLNEKYSFIFVKEKG